MGKVSYAVKKRYEDKTYRMITVRIPIALAEEFRQKTAENGDSQAQIFKQAIERYLDEHK